MPSRRQVQLRYAEYYEKVLREAEHNYNKGGDNLTQAITLLEMDWSNIQAAQSWVETHAQEDATAKKLLLAYASDGEAVRDVRQNAHERINWAESALTETQSDTKSAILMAQKIMEEASAKSTEIINTAKRNELILLGMLGNAHFVLGEFEKTRKYHHQTLEIAQETGNKYWEGRALNGLGSMNIALGDYEEAIKYVQQALEIARETGNTREESNTLGYLGDAYFRLEQYERAIENYQRALVMSREIGDKKAEARHLNSMGSAWNDLEQYTEAKKNIEDALTISRQMKDRRAEGIYLGNLGVTHTNLRNYDMAQKAHEQALTASRETEDKSNEGNQLYNLGKLHLNLGQHEKAIEFYEYALVIFEELGFNHLVEEVKRNIIKAQVALRYSSHAE